MTILMSVNLKGGVAKTTSAVAIAECLATSGYRTLLIDADHQCMAGELMLGEERQLRCERTKRTLHDLFAAMLEPDFNTDQFESCITRKVSNIGGGLPRLSVLPCSIRMDDFTANMAKARRGYNSSEEWLRILSRRRAQLRRWVNANFDYAVIDCPPSLAIQVKFLLSVADSYIVPCVPDHLSVRGSRYLMNRIKGHGYKIRGMGTLWSLYRSEVAVHRRFVEAARARLTPFDELPLPFESVIPNATRIAEAADVSGVPATFRKKYTAQFAKLFEELCGEIVRRAEGQQRSEELEPAMVYSSRGQD